MFICKHLIFELFPLVAVSVQDILAPGFWISSEQRIICYSEDELTLVTAFSICSQIPSEATELWKRLWQKLSSLCAWFVSDLLLCPSEDPFLAKNLLSLCMLMTLQNMGYVRFACPVLPGRTVCCGGILVLFFSS